MPIQGVDPIVPPHQSFVYSDEHLLPITHCDRRGDLVPPPAASPPEGRSYPLSSTWVYEEDHRYRSRFVYSAAYHLKDIERHRTRLLVTDTPPNVIPKKVDGHFITEDVPGMVRMTPGIPFVYHVNGNRDAVHTVACLHTLESIRPYPCFSQVLDLSVQLSKLSWGCKAHNSTPEIPRISRLPGLKLNDRSKNVDLSTTSFDGSYSLAHTLLEGEGPGTVLPAVQADTRMARSQISSVLKCLNGLYHLVMPLCLSRFELEITDFHSKVNNVMSFGGLMPNGTGCQLNASSLGKILSSVIGTQGSWHPDFKDDVTRLTLFVLLLLVGPSVYSEFFWLMLKPTSMLDGYPGSFCLGRPGLYVRELGAWITFIAFKGNDIHSGFAPMEESGDHEEWINSIIAPAWDHAGPENRLGYVIYPSSAAIQRSAAMNVTPSQLFGNFGSVQPHKTGQHTFARQGQVTLGDQDDFSHRMGWESVAALVNQLAQCNLSLRLDVNTLLQNITYKRNEDGVEVPLRPFPYHPIRDAEHIALYRAYYQHYRDQCKSLQIYISRKEYARIRDEMRSRNAAATAHSIYHPTERQSLAMSSLSSSNAQIEEVVDRIVDSGKVWFILFTEQLIYLQSHSLPRLTSK